MSGDEKEIAIYFAFPDGVFDYVCAECTALCCRGQGFRGSLKRELPQLLTIYQALQSAVVAREGHVLRFSTPAGRCFFLDEDNLCRVEKDHGPDLKPGICTLFPFSKLARIGKTVVISPNFICPIRLNVPARIGRVQGTHATVETTARASGFLDREYAATYLPAPPLHHSTNPRNVISREASFRDVCARSLGRRTFMDVLKAESLDPNQLVTDSKRATRVLGLRRGSAPEKRDYVDELLLALAPSHRLSLLHLSPEAMLRGLAIGEAMVRRVMSLSSVALSPQGAQSILNNTGSAVRLLARADETIDLPSPAEPKSPSFGDPSMAFAAFTALREIGKGAGILAAMEKSIKPGMKTADRSALLVQLGSQLEHLPATIVKSRTPSKPLCSTGDDSPIARSRLKHPANKL